MYLVLTALLALNVSAEILNAFRTVNSSLEKTNVLVNTSTSNYMRSLDKKLSAPETHDKAVIWVPVAQAAQKVAATAFEKVQILKDSLLKLSGFDPAKNHDSTYKEDDINTPERVMVEGGQGKKLYAILSDFKKDILANPAVAAELASSFPLDLTPPKSKNKASNSWEAAYFHMTPTIAALTILSKFQNDIRTAENKVVEFCHKQVGQVDIPIDSYQPVVEQSSSYVMNGQEVEITAGLAAFNSHNQPTISIDGQSEATGLDGLVSKKFIANGVGTHSVHIVINYKDQYNQPKSITKDVTYTVGEPTGITVSADSVKVLYIGLQNPISITGGVKGAESLKASISQGTLTSQGNGRFIATVETPGKATINISTSDGKTVTSEFRVKSIPNPTPKVGNSAGGRIATNEFKSQLGVRADMQDFVFNGVKYDVTGFTIICTGKAFDAIGPQVVNNDGAYFTPEAKKIIEMCKPGSSVILDRIKVSGPDGTRTLPQTIAFNLY